MKISTLAVILSSATNLFMKHERNITESKVFASTFSYSVVYARLSISVMPGSSGLVPFAYGDNERRHVCSGLFQKRVLFAWRRDNTKINAAGKG